MFSPAGNSQQPPNSPPLQQAPPAGSNPPAPALAPISSPEVDALVAMLVPEIKKRHFSSVVVFGAMGPTDDVTVLGLSVGDGVSESLARQAEQFQVIDRAKLRERIQREQIGEAALASRVSAGGIAEKLKAQGIVFVTIGNVEESRALISLLLFDAHHKVRNAVASKSALVPLETRYKDAAFVSLVGYSQKEGTSHKADATLHDAARPPHCLRCPAPEFKRVTKTVNGDIWVKVEVSEKGIVTEAKVTQSLGPESDESVIEAVKNWIFKPALDTTGKAIPSQVIVRITRESF
jgi:TonB family protein